MISYANTIISIFGMDKVVSTIGILLILVGILLVFIFVIIGKYKRDKIALFCTGIFLITLGCVGNLLSNFFGHTTLLSVKYNGTLSLEFLAQLITIIAGFGGIIYQLQVQKAQNIKNHEQSLKIQVFKEISERIEDSSPEGVATTLNLLVGKLQANINQQIEKGVKYQPPPFKIEDIQLDFSVIHSRLCKVCNSLERHEIISEHIYLFKRLLDYKRQELAEIYLRLVTFLVYVLPSDKGIKDPSQCYMPSDEDLTKLKEVVTEFHYISSCITAYLYDIQIELQNTFLYDLFNRKVPLREPLDINEIVLTSENEEKLKKAKLFLYEKNKQRDEALRHTS